MNTQQQELISALIDGELTEQEASEALDFLLSDQSAQRQWEEYCTMHDALHGQYGASISGSLKNRLREEAQRTSTFTISTNTVKTPQWQTITNITKTWRDYLPANQSWYKGAGVAAAIGAVAIALWVLSPSADDTTVMTVQTTPTQEAEIARTELDITDFSEVGYDENIHHDPYFAAYQKAHVTNDLMQTNYVLNPEQQRGVRQ